MCSAIRGVVHLPRSSQALARSHNTHRNNLCHQSILAAHDFGVACKHTAKVARHNLLPAATGANGFSGQEPLSADSQAAGSGPQSKTNSNSPILSSGLKLVHVLLFIFILLGGILFVSLALQFRGDMNFESAVGKVLKRISASIAFRQLVVISTLILLVRFGLNWFLKGATKWQLFGGQADRNKMVFMLKEIYQPLELLLIVAGLCTIADSFVPQLISVPKSVVSHFVRATLAITFVISAANVLMRLKRQLCQENAWQAELGGDITVQRRWEAYDKLGTFGVYSLAFVFVVQAMGLEVTSVLAIGGVGGLAIGLAGREIFENLFNGFLILTSNPFEVGDEVSFLYNGNKVEGMVMDIGWYRTAIRSYEREVHIIPNAVFSKNTVLNITRKGREWRFFEMISIRVQDVTKASAIVADCRKIIKNDTRIINSLHKRVYLDKITLDDCKVYISFYVEAPSRDVFMSFKQDFLLGFVDCVHRNGAMLAQNKLMVEMLPVDGLLPSRASMASAVASLSSYDDMPGQLPAPPSAAVPQPAPQLQLSQPRPSGKANGNGTGSPGGSGAPGAPVQGQGVEGGGYAEGGSRAPALQQMPAGVLMPSSYAPAGAAAGAMATATTMAVMATMSSSQGEQYFAPQYPQRPGGYSETEPPASSYTSGTMPPPKLPTAAKQQLLTSIDDY